MLSAMLHGRRVPAGDSRWPVARPALLILITAVVVMGLVGGPVLANTAPARTAPSPGPAPDAVPVAPPVAGDPTPGYFFVEGLTASPAYLFAGNTTYLSADAFSSDVLKYVYDGLPPGCATHNTDSLACTPSAVDGAGTFDITVVVTDTNASASPHKESASTSLVVYPGHPLVENQTMFAVNPSVVSNLNASTAACTPPIASPPYYQYFCYPEAQDPTLLTLGNGEVGLSTELYTDLTANTCPEAANATVARVGFSLSSDGGATFGPAVSLGNDTCTYLDAIEPSFEADGAHVYGAFVEENSTEFAADYTSRAGSAIGFASSTNNGATFAVTRTLVAGGAYADPQVASHGNDVYIVYEEIANSTHKIGGGVYPISTLLLASTNAGATFTGPYHLPGLNSAQDYTAMSPAIAVNASGTIAIAYATNRTCLSPGTSGACNAYGDSIVVVTSSAHGTNLQGPYLVATGAGESACYVGSCLPGFFESTPQITVEYAPNGSELYVAYASTYLGGVGTLGPNSTTGVFAAESADGGVSWSGGPVAAATGTSLLRSYDPDLGASSTDVYLTYVQANASAGLYGFADSLSQWWDASPVGPTLAWGGPDAINVDSFAQSGGSVNATELSYSGDSSTIGFTAGGTPLVAFALPLAPVTTLSNGPGYYDVNTSYETDLAVGSLLTAGGPGTVSVVFMQEQLPVGTVWSFTLNGVDYAVSAPAVEFDNLPEGEPVIDGANFQPGVWEIVTTYYNASVQEYYYSQTVLFQFDVWAGVEFFTFPGGIGSWITADFDYFEVDPYVFTTPYPAYVYADWSQEEEEIYQNGTFIEYPESEISYGSDAGNYYASCEYVECAYPTPWYFPLGTTFSLNITQIAYDAPPPDYWTGQGNGSYTGPSVPDGYEGCFESYECPLSTGTITVNGPINETLWLGDAPENLSANVTISAAGLPSSSVFGVTVDSTHYTAPAASDLTLRNVSAGAHTLSHISATSSAPGWKYFGSPLGPNPFVSPIETGIQLRFDSYQDLAVPAGLVTFEAPEIAAGTSWSLTFNGTDYTSTTPWINLTAHPGTYAWSPGDAVSPGGSTGYVPTSSGGNISVTPGGVYSINYTSAYQVVVLSSTGGLIAAQGAAPSTSQTLWATGGQTVDLSAQVSSGYSFEGWSGTGSGSYSGTARNPSVVVSGPVVESATFAPLPGARFNLTVDESGLPTGTWWTVGVGGQGYSSDGIGITVGNLWPWSAGSSGAYSLGASVVYQNSTNLTRFVPFGFPGTVGTNGSLTPPVVIDFDSQVFVQASGSGGGSVETTYLGAPVGSSAWVAQGATVNFTALTDPGYSFEGWSGIGAGSYTGPLSGVTVTAAGPITEVAEFSPATTTQAPQYSVTFSLSTPVANGTEWSVTFGGVGYASSTPNLTIPDLTAGTYSVLLNTATSPNGLTQYTATALDPAAYTVRSNATVYVSYADSFWVSVSAGVGGSVTPGSGWYAAGSVLYLVATPNATYSFAGWTGSSGGYSGSNATASIFVSGSLTEVATFTPTSAAAAASSIWQNPETWLGLGAAGLIVGLAIGILFSRFGTRTTPRRTAPSGREATPRSGSE
ncbi:MAG: hypothetical protein WBE40_03270 [Thermoplasmata archaeon]